MKALGSKLKNLGLYMARLKDLMYTLINCLLLSLGALICLLALSIGIEAGKKKILKRLSKELGVPSSKLEDAIQTLVITKDIWFDAIRYAYLCI